MVNKLNCLGACIFLELVLRLGLLFLLLSQEDSCLLTYS